MRMSDIVSSLDAGFFPTAGLVIFAALFAVLVWRTFRKDAAETERAASMPLFDDAPTGGEEALS